MKTARRAARKRARASPKKARPAAAAPDLVLSVQYAIRPRNVPTRRELRKWVRAALGADARMTVRVVGLAEGRALNRRYRGKDHATNVLTFVLRGRPPYEGDLALCAPVISREARSQGKDVKAHYAHLTVHGTLHLQGYEHEHEIAAVRMEKRETRILQRLGYPDPYTYHG